MYPQFDAVSQQFYTLVDRNVYSYSVSGDASQHSLCPSEDPNYLSASANSDIDLDVNGMPMHYYFEHQLLRKHFKDTTFPSRFHLNWTVYIL